MLSNERLNILERIEKVKLDRNGKFYALNYLPYAPKFNGQYLDDIDYNSLTDHQLSTFYMAITAGVERAGNYE